MKPSLFFILFFSVLTSQAFASECPNGSHWKISGTSAVEGESFERLSDAAVTWCDSYYHGSNNLAEEFAFISCDLGDISVNWRGQISASVKLNLVKYELDASGGRGQKSIVNRAYKWCN